MMGIAAFAQGGGGSGRHATTLGHLFDRKCLREKNSSDRMKTILTMRSALWTRIIRKTETIIKRIKIIKGLVLRP